MINRLKKEYQKKRRGSMTTTRTDTVEFEAMGLDGKAVAGGHFFLKFLDLAVFKLHDLSAVGADQVVVMAFVGDIVVLGLGAEVPGLRQARFAKEVERAVDRCEAQVRIFFGQLVIHLFRGDVFLLEESIEDELTLTRDLKLVFGEMLFQHLHLFGVFWHSVRPGFQ